MRNLSLLTLMSVSALASGCELLEEEIIEDTADTATDDTDDTGTDDTGTDDTGEEPEPEVSHVRFVNVNPDIAATIQVDIGGDGVDAESTLYFTQGTDFMEIPAGNGDVKVLDDTGATVAEVKDFPFGADQSYSIAPTNQPGMWIKLYLPDGIPADHARVNIRNAYQGAEVDAWLMYWNGEAYDVDYTFSYGANGEWIKDLPYHAASVQFEHLYGDDQDQLLVDWEFSGIVQLGNNQVVDVYTLLMGDCSYLSSTCEPFLLAQFADGSTATVELTYGWVPQ